MIYQVPRVLQIGIKGHANLIPVVDFAPGLILGLNLLGEKSLVAVGAFGMPCSAGQAKREMLSRSVIVIRIGTKNTTDGRFVEPKYAQSSPHLR